MMSAHTGNTGTFIGHSLLPKVTGLPQVTGSGAPQVTGLPQVTESLIPQSLIPGSLMSQSSAAPTKVMVPCSMRRSENHCQPNSHLTAISGEIRTYNGQKYLVNRLVGYCGRAGTAENLHNVANGIDGQFTVYSANGFKAVEIFVHPENGRVQRLHFHKSTDTAATGVVVVGQPEHHHGQDLLVRATPLLDDSDPEIRQRKATAVSSVHEDCGADRPLFIVRVDILYKHGSDSINEYGKSTVGLPDLEAARLQSAPAGPPRVLPRLLLAKKPTVSTVSPSLPVRKLKEESHLTVDSIHPASIAIKSRSSSSSLFLPLGGIALACILLYVIYKYGKRSNLTTTTTPISQNQNIQRPAYANLPIVVPTVVPQPTIEQVVATPRYTRPTIVSARLSSSASSR